MMSFSMVQSASGAGQYFMEADDYYLKSNEYEGRFQWWGKGAQKLGLSKEVQAEDFINLLNGRLPNGVQLPGRVKDGKRRPGFDITFSAPKSISILALIYEKHELIDAHNKAVDMVLTEIEKDCAQARVVHDGEVGFERTANLIAAKFLHDTSRALDPNLHTHAVVMNATERLDGNWRALASNTGMLQDKGRTNGFFETIHHRQHYYGSIYASALAKGVVAAGYELEIHDNAKFVNFDIKGVPKELLESFSKRRGEIEKLLAKMGATSAKAADFATLATRDQKKSVDRDVLREIWKGEASSKFADFNPDHLKQDFAGKEDIKSEKAKAVLMAREAVMSATQHFSESRLAFTNSDLVTKSLQFSLGKVSFPQVNEMVETLLKENVLVALNESEMTSKDILSFEERLISSTQKVVKNGAPVKVNDAALDRMEISQNERDVVRGVLKSKEGMSIVNLKLGSNHEQFMEALLDTAERGGKQVKILTTTRLNSAGTQSKIKRKASNLWQWVLNLNKPEIVQTMRGYLYQNGHVDEFSKMNERGKDFLIIDASHKMGYEDFEGLLRIGDERGAKLVFLNVDEGMKGYKLGNPIDLMRKAKVQEFSLLAGKRNGPVISAAILEMKEDGERAKFIAAKYAGMDEGLQCDTHVLAHSQKQVDLLNTRIREELKNQGILSREEISLRVLSPVFLTKTEQGYSTQYQQGMIIRRFHEGQLEQYRVVKQIQEDNVLILANQAHEKVHWNPRKDPWKASIFNEDEILVGKGDRLIASDNIKKHMGIEGGHQLKVIDIERNVRVKGKKEASIILANETTGEALTLSESALYHSTLKYHYATTVSRAGAEQRSNVILDIKSFAANEAVMKEVASRATHSLDIVTDDAKKLAIFAKREEIKLTMMDTLITQQDEIPELTKYIDQNETFKSLETDFNHIADLLKKKFKTIDERTLVEKALDYSVALLSEREAAFEHQELVKMALSHSMRQLANQPGSKPILASELTAELQKYQDEGKLILSQHGTHWVPKEALECEQSIIQHLKDSKGAKEAILSREDATKALEPYREAGKLTDGQWGAAYLILTSKDRFVMVQGDAGTGKTSMVETVKNVLLAIQPVLAENGISLQGVAPTHPAKNELIKVGLPSKTLKNFLVEYGQAEGNEGLDFTNTVFVLDEYSMVSGKDDVEFMRIIQKYNGRAPKLGDIKQFESIAASPAMSIALKSGLIDVAYMTEKVRQNKKTDPEAFEIAEAATRGDIAKAIQIAEGVKAKRYIERDESRMTMTEQLRLSNSVVEIKGGRPVLNEDGEKEEKTTLHEAFAREYVLRTPETRKKSAFIVQTNKNRGIINECIREELKVAGELPQVGGTKIRRLIALDGKQAEIKEGNLGGATHIRLGNAYFEIMELDKKNYSVLVRGEDQAIKAIHLKKELARYKDNVELFTQAASEVVPNDLIMIKKSDPKRGLVVNQEYVVQEVEGSRKLHLKSDSGAALVLDTSILGDTHWDYAYTKTGYSQQGASKFFVADFRPSTDEKLAHVRSAYITMTRQIKHFMIFTDDKAAILTKLIRPSDKYSALEVLVQDSPLPVKGSPDAQSQRGSSTTQNKTISQKAEKTETEHFDAKEIVFQLSNHAEMVVEHLLGKPTQASGKEWRFGKKGSLTISMSGEKRGTWFNFETGEGGNLLSLIEQELGLNLKSGADFKQALKYASNIVGGGHMTLSRRPQVKVAKGVGSSESKSTHAIVEKLVRESIPVPGTMAERYLKEHRGIEDAHSPSLRFHERVYSHTEEDKLGQKKAMYYPALVGIAVNEEGHPIGVQATYLDSKTANKVKAQSDAFIGKRSFGKISGSHITISEGMGDAKVSFIAEGIETAMSVREAAASHQVIAVLSKSNFKNVDPNRLAKIVFLVMDNDGKDTLLSGKVIRDAVDRLEKAGKEVKLILPRKEKTDLNDYLKSGGKKAVKEELSRHLSKDKLFEKMNELESLRKQAGKITKGSLEELTLQDISQKELDKLLKSAQQKSIRGQPRPITHQKIKQIHDREIG